MFLKVQALFNIWFQFYDFWSFVLSRWFYGFILLWSQIQTAVYLSAYSQFFSEITHKVFLIFWMMLDIKIFKKWTSQIFSKIFIYSCLGKRAIKMDQKRSKKKVFIIFWQNLPLDFTENSRQWKVILWFYIA